MTLRPHVSMGDRFGGGACPANASGKTSENIEIEWRNCDMMPAQGSQKTKLMCLLNARGSSGDVR